MPKYDRLLHFQILGKVGSFLILLLAMFMMFVPFHEKYCDLNHGNRRGT